MQKWINCARCGWRVKFQQATMINTHGKVLAAVCKCCARKENANGKHNTGVEIRD